jgi:hypothetical protein
VFLIYRLTTGAFTIDSSTPTLTENLNEHPIYTLNLYLNLLFQFCHYQRKEESFQLFFSDLVPFEIFSVLFSFLVTKSINICLNLLFPIYFPPSLFLSIIISLFILFIFPTSTFSVHFFQLFSPFIFPSLSIKSHY